MQRWDFNGDGRENYPSGLKCQDADILLRDHHVEFLTFLAEESGSTVSVALSKILARTVASPKKSPSKPSKSVRKHLVFIPAQLAMIDRMAVLFGVQRSDIVRRLIDEAIALQPTPSQSARVA